MILNFENIIVYEKTLSKRLETKRAKRSSS